MAMVKCRECQAEISDRAITCPKCGAPAMQSFVGASATAIDHSRRKPPWVRSIPAFLIIGLVAVVAYLMITAEEGGALGRGETVYWLAVVIVATVCGFIGYAVANGKQQGQLGFVVAFILGPFGILIAALLPHRKKCPHCFKGVDKRARICPSCRTPLVGQRARM